VRDRPDPQAAGPDDLAEIERLGRVVPTCGHRLTCCGRRDSTRLRFRSPRPSSAPRGRCRDRSRQSSRPRMRGDGHGGPAQPPRHRETRGPRRPHRTGRPPGQNHLCVGHDPTANPTATRRRRSVDSTLCRALVVGRWAATHRCHGVVGVVGLALHCRHRFLAARPQDGWRMSCVGWNRSRWATARHQALPAVSQTRAFQRLFALRRASPGCCDRAAGLHVDRAAGVVPARRRRRCLPQPRVTEAVPRRQTRPTFRRHRLQRWNARGDHHNCRRFHQTGSDGPRDPSPDGPHHAPHRVCHDHRVGPDGVGPDVRALRSTRRDRRLVGRSAHRYRRARHLPNHCRWTIRDASQDRLPGAGGSPSIEVAVPHRGWGGAVPLPTGGRIQRRDRMPGRPNCRSSWHSDGGVGAAGQAVVAAAQQPAAAVVPGRGRRQAIRPDRPMDLSLLSWKKSRWRRP
jgi:hypothetical protein